MSLCCGTVCGEGVREKTMLLAWLLLLSITCPTTHNQTEPFWCRFQDGWVCVHSGTLWVSPRNSPVRLGVSPPAASTPTGVFTQWFEALFPRAGALGCRVCFTAPAVPPGLSMCKCGAAGSASHHLVGSASCSLACPVPQSTTSLLSLIHI